MAPHSRVCSARRDHHRPRGGDRRRRHAHGAGGETSGEGKVADIDAPESKQPYGTRSRQSLAALCFNKQARLDTIGKDRNGRTIATVHCDGIDANAEQVRQGMAWVFDERYARKDSPLYALQAQAKATNRGLGHDPEPVPPWKWRRRKR
jgi:endonuclease YncB( thermonuclease family)